MSNFMEIIHDFKTSKNNTILLFVYITAPFDAVPTLRTFVSENSSGVQMSNFMEIIHDFKTSKNNTILLFVYITYFINFATKLYMLIYE